MSDKKNTYEAVSPIKRNGKFYEIGDPMKLTEEEAEGLHVELASAGQATDDGSGDGFDASAGSHDNDAKEAIAYIEDAVEPLLDGFVDPEKEERVTVLRAWDERFDTDLSGD